MPELPEVETIVRALANGGREGPAITGRIIQTGEIYWPRSVAAPAPGTLWSVDYNGIVMLSYPGQIAARNLVALEALSGTVTASGEDFLTLDTPDGACRVALKPNARLPEAINVGDAVTVYMQKNRTAPADGSFVADVVIIEP